jgi:hypothetical protein
MCMIHKVIFAAATLLASSVCHAGPIVQWIGPGSNGHYYTATDTNLSWTGANTLAISQGGYLASVLSQAENDFLRTTFSSVLGPSWIGLTDQAVEGTFVWTSGEPVSYTNWAPGEPNNQSGIEDFGLILSNGSWNDGTDSGGLFRGIIEFNDNPAAVPEPSSLISLGLGFAVVAACAARRWSKCLAG